MDGESMKSGSKFGDAAGSVLRVSKEMNDRKSTEPTKSFFVSDYAHGDIVYLITDVDQRKRIIDAVMFTIGEGVQYRLACGTTSSWHHSIEMSRDRDFTCPEN